VKSTAAVQEMEQSLAKAGVKSLAEGEVTCCYSVQNKIWVTDPDGTRLCDSTIELAGTPSAELSSSGCSRSSSVRTVFSRMAVFPSRRALPLNATTFMRAPFSGGYVEGPGHATWSEVHQGAAGPAAMRYNLFLASGQHGPAPAGGEGLGVRPSRMRRGAATGRLTARPKGRMIILGGTTDDT